MTRGYGSSTALCGIACLLTAAASCAVAQQRIIELGHAFPGYSDAGRAGIVVKDVDGDGRDDFLYSADTYALHWSFESDSLLFVVGDDGSSPPRLKQSLVVPTPRVAALAASPRDDGLVYVLAADGTAMQYGGKPLRKQGEFPTVDDPESALVADVDGNGIDDIVVARYGQVEAYRTDTGERLWQTLDAAAGASIAWLPADADNPARIVCGRGGILDAASGVVLGSRADRFGNQVLAGRLDPSLGPQIVGINATPSQLPISVHHSVAPWDLDWGFDPGEPQGIAAAALADVDDAGVDRIVFASHDTNTLRILDGASHGEQSPALQTVGANAQAISSVGLTGTGRHLAAATGIPWYEPSSSRGGRFELIDLASRSSVFQIDVMRRRYGTVAAGDTDGDGHPEWLVGATDFSGMSWAALQLLDPQSGELAWASPDTYGDNLIQLDAVTSVAVAQLRPGTAADIVIVGKQLSVGSVTVLDGATRSVRLRFSPSYPPSPHAPDLRGLAFHDHDGDGTRDIVLVVMGWPPSPPLIQVFSGADGTLLASSAELPVAANETVNDLLRVDGPGGPELILATSSKLQGYDASTLEPRWTRPVTSAGIRYVEGGVNGPELLVFNADGGISFYDAATRAFLRSVPTPGPVTAAVALGGVHDLVIADDGHLHLLDGMTGEVRASSDYLGTGLAWGNQLAALPAGNGSWLLLAGADVGYFRHRVDLTDTLFADGFDPPTR